MNNIIFNYHHNIITKNTILFILQNLKILFLNYHIIFYFICTWKLKKYIIYFIKTNSIISA